MKEPDLVLDLGHAALRAGLPAAAAAGHAGAGEAPCGPGGDPAGRVGLGVELLQHLVLDVLAVPDDVLLPVGLRHHEERVVGEGDLRGGGGGRLGTGDLRLGLGTAKKQGSELIDQRET